MSFMVPTTFAAPQTYRLPCPTIQVQTLGPIVPSVWTIVSRYEPFRQLVVQAHLQDFLNDPQTIVTVMAPLCIPTSQTTQLVCTDASTSPTRVSVLDLSFEASLAMVQSVSVPGVLTTDTMNQSNYTAYRTHHPYRMLHVKSKPTILLNNTSHIVVGNVVASNGLVHIVDQFPMPI
ncbi:hypothetical protein MIV081L [Invertebrate iridescent virus 3]|uniref:Putative FAS1 domain-containing protein 081L n=1 Tax=Invertebrate iridescent virus 3 TaxID=345201 RepID=081L_IIV3|nr:hypothetical protein MIV081L [Invertebrate iridescent virus 3]Q196X9.1 RecName: Full=Putative FAS1 domain-containing protein 081L [Invertebrate iridescent virus 3]ABF82111.1 hypothetical protein MIV081L [Invertebrate iridescent virus 3]